MTPDEIGRLTIAEVEEIASRATSALNAFREAQSALGLAAPGAFKPSHHDDSRPVVVTANPFAPPNSPATEAFLASQKAERDRLLELNRAKEEETQAALRNS